MEQPQLIDAATHAVLRAKIDRAEAWRGDKESYKIEEAPDYVREVSNGMRTQVYLFEMYRDKPRELTAYTNDRDQITMWTGEAVGTYRVLSRWKQKGGEMRYIEARLPGLGIYRGRNSAPGWYVNLKRVN